MNPPIEDHTMDQDELESEERWCDARRSEVASYLAREGVAHGEIGQWPAWHLAPHVSVWAIESLANPGWVGWWVICGDLPTDYVSAASIKTPRDALLSFAARWRSAADHMARGEPSPGFTIGPRSEWSSLAPMLASRADALQDMATDTALWDGY